MEVKLLFCASLFFVCPLLAKLSESDIAALAVDNKLEKVAEGIISASSAKEAKIGASVYSDTFKKDPKPAGGTVETPWTGKAADAKVKIGTGEVAIKDLTATQKFMSLFGKDQVGKKVVDDLKPTTTEDKNELNKIGQSIIDKAA